MTGETFDDRLVAQLAQELDHAEQTRERIRPFSVR